MAELAPGSQFGAYRIESVAGQGGMGVVYRATQLGLDRAVALKVITPEFAHDEEFRARFQRESRLAASIEHPNVIPVYEAGEHDGTLFLAMRFVDGTDLKSLLSREGRLEPIRAARFVAQIANALDAAHAAGLVHRDVKPANALLASQDHVYLTDFGLTKRAASGSAMTKTGQMVGTVDYVAPEQVEGGSVDARTDVYSLACVYYHLLTGSVPFDKPSEMAKLYAHVHEDPPRASDVVPGLPGAIDDVIWRGMAKEQTKRFLSAGDLGRAAAAAAEQRTIAEPERSVARGEAAPVPVAEAPTVQKPVAEPEPAAAPAAASGPPVARPRNLKLWAIGAAVLVVAGVLAALLTGGGNDSGSSSDSSGGSVVQVTRANALDAASTFADGVNEQNISNFEDLYKGGFSQRIDIPTCSGAKQPMNLDAALAEWQCMFDNADDDQYAMKLSGQTSDPATKTLTANYTMSHQGTQIAKGKVSFHLIPGVDFPRMDKVVFSDGTGTFKPTEQFAAGSSSATQAPRPLTRAGAIATVAQFADYWTDENLGGLEGVFGGTGFKLTVKGPTCSGAKSPMNLDAALAEFDCDFQKLALPEVKATATTIDTKAKTASGTWSLTDEGKAISGGRFKMHFVPQRTDANPILDSLELVEK
ncbi:MAG TPA: serine/threonine-protein kinase [Thermoleophilaceae bacterium]